jgi:hypothetical protein
MTLSEVAPGPKESMAVVSYVIAGVFSKFSWLTVELFLEQEMAKTKLR